MSIMVFVLGGFGYGLLEIVWRGYTHPTMLILGGACFLAIWNISKKYSELSYLKKSILATAVITAAEYTAGYAVNIRMGMNVWSYEDIKFNLHGQICLYYCVLWFLLSFVLIKISENIREKYKI